MFARSRRSTVRCETETIEARAYEKQIHILERSYTYKSRFGIVRETSDSGWGKNGGDIGNLIDFSHARDGKEKEKERDIRWNTATSVAGGNKIGGRGFGRSDVVLELGDEPGGRLRESIDGVRELEWFTLKSRH